MEFSGTYDFDASRASVWAALNDPRVLQATIPGCQDLTQEGARRYRADLRLKFGLLRFGVTGRLRVEVIVEAESYRLHGSSEPTLFGSGSGVADVRLRDAADGGTHLAYDLVCDLEGRLAKLGAAAVSGQLQRLGTKFFQRFEAAMNAQSL